MDNMLKEQLPTGQETPLLGATHEANAGFRQPTWAEQNQGLAALDLLSRAGHGVELSPTVNPPDPGKFKQRWRESCIFAGPTYIDPQLRQAEARIRNGETLSAPAKMAIQNQGSIEVTLGEQLKELRLARLVYQTPEEAARSLRDHENIVRLEIDRYQQEAPNIAGTSQFALLNSKVPLTRAEYYKKLEATQSLIENPPELQRFRERLGHLEKEYGSEYLKRMADRFRRFELVCRMPNEQDLPLRVPLEDAMNQLKMMAPQRGMPTEDQIRALEQMVEHERVEAMKQMGLGGAMQMGGEIGGEYYIGMYQKAWDEFIDAFNTFPSDIQDEIVVNYIIGGSMLGSQFSGFYRKGLEQRGRLPSKYTPWLNAIEHFQKTSQIEGYIPPEQIFQALQSTKPEVLAFPDVHTAHHRLWLAGEERPREFSLSSRDMIGVLGKLDVMARLGINDAASFAAVRNTEFGAYLFRQMGYTPEEAQKIGSGDMEPPVLVRDNWLSTVRRQEITDIWDWVGETALDKLIVPMAWLKWARADVEFAPLDLKRRAILSLRGLELADYRLGYAIDLPPDQFLNMIAVFGSAISIDHKAMLKWVGERFSREPLGKEQRGKIWSDTITISRPSIASSRELAEMAMGVGQYNKTGDGYRKAVHRGMEQILPGQSPALRHPDLWKWRWFENCDGDPSQWKYIGDKTGGLTLAETEVVFSEYDFTEELRACGLSEREIQGMERTGINGWKNLLNNATLGLLEWKKMGYTTGDKAWRYEGKKEKLQDAIVSLLRVVSGDEPHAVSAVAMEQTGAPGGVSLPKVNPEVIKKGLEGAIKELTGAISGASALVGNDTQKAIAEGAIRMYMDGHAAVKLSTLVEDLEVKDLKQGDNWSVALLTREDIASERVTALMQAGFYFQTDPNRKKDYLISPLAAPVPKLVPAGKLLDKLEEALQEKQGQLSDRETYLKKAVAHLKDKKYFCWATLIKGEADVPLTLFMETLKENTSGTFSGATYYAIEKYIAEFAQREQGMGLHNPKMSEPRLA